MYISCLICERIQLIKENKNPYFVKELKTGYVVIGDYQYFKGYTLFLCKTHVIELHELPFDFKNEFLKEMSIVAEAVYKAFKPQKLNYELLGNSDPHLHWHIFPRYKKEPYKGPVWNVEKKLRYSETVRPSLKELGQIKTKLLKKLI